MSSLTAAEPFTTKDGSTIRELHHTEAQSLAEATLEPGQATERYARRRTRTTTRSSSSRPSAT